MLSAGDARQLHYALKVVRAGVPVNCNAELNVQYDSARDRARGPRALQAVSRAQVDPSSSSRVFPPAARNCFTILSLPRIIANSSAVWRALPKTQTTSLTSTP